MIQTRVCTNRTSTCTKLGSEDLALPMQATDGKERVRPRGSSLQGPRSRAAKSLTTFARGSRPTFSEHGVSLINNLHIAH